VAKAILEGFPHEVRIVRSSDYRVLYRTGRKIHSERFILFWRENRTGHHRLGITVSRKVGNSVVRNRIKRLLREVFRRSMREIPGQVDIVVNVKASCAKVKYVELRSEFLVAFKRICQY
jgi:ribonuclease P protein component